MDYYIDDFPQFSSLPPEIRVMIWEACVPRRAISLILDDDEPVPVLQPPVISQVCCESREVFIKHFRAGPYMALGWFRIETDVFLWKPFPDILFKLHWLFRTDNFFMNLQSVTLCDACSCDWLDDMGDRSWDPIRAYSSWRLSEDKDPSGIRFFFRFMLEEKCKLRTVNLFNNTCRSRESFTLENSLLSYEIGTLFGNDSVVLVDHTDTAEVNRVASILKTDDSTRFCVAGLTRISKVLSERQQLAHWNGLLFDYKLMWLSEIYQKDRVRDLPDDPPDVGGWDEEKMSLRLNWNENDPVVKKCLDKMPEIKFVYVILSED
ncbi:hypothetical protein F4781DRAFT_84919 [Annulohypoxylon bovei var. microspora]|nr:hypothetical protein F4781DRAFT_84919 [Annulohypoxylon bovei var. microspora]